MFEIIMLLAFAYAGFGRLLPAGKPLTRDQVTRKGSPRLLESGAGRGKGEKKKNRSPLAREERSKVNGAGAEATNASLCTHSFQPADDAPFFRPGRQDAVGRRAGKLPARAA